MRPLVVSYSYSCAYDFKACKHGVCGCPAMLHEYMVATEEREGRECPVNMLRHQLRCTVTRHKDQQACCSSRKVAAHTHL
jgi:hypothetical protein